jgi:hypothetical protein
MNKFLAVTVMTQVCGCVTFMPTENQNYQTQRVEMARDLPEETVLAAAARNARLQGWDVVMVDTVHGRMEALTPVDGTEGLITRERWTFTVVQGEMAVEMTMEARDGEENRWVSRREVCAGYQYSREQEQLAQVNALVQLDTQRQWAQR